jgi:hypothetical protein
VKITRVTIQMSRKTSKNFGSFGNEIELSASVMEGENHEDVIIQLQKECLHNLLKRNPFDEAARRAAQKKTAAKEDTQI